MAIHTYAPLVTQFQADVPAKGAIQRFFAALFGRRNGSGERMLEVSAGRRIAGQPDGLAMLEREVDRIRLQSRHWSGGYFPFHTGLRFSAKARAPSS
jgi:hypothetical protein